MMSAGKLVKQARKEARLTQRELADQIGVDYTYISKIEHSAAIPSESTVRKIADALNITDPDELCIAFGHMQIESLSAELERTKLERDAYRTAYRNLCHMMETILYNTEQGTQYSLEDVRRGIQSSVEISVRPIHKFNEGKQS